VQFQKKGVWAEGKKQMEGLTRVGTKIKTKLKNKSSKKRIVKGGRERTVKKGQVGMNN